ncbi:MAG: flagellar FlbD family protein [Acidobacteriaceae bacterium]
MIELTRLNGDPMVVNSDLIRYAEASPDTVITLITGDKIVVSESTRELIERVVAFRSRLLQHAFPEGAIIVDPSQSIAASAAVTAATAAATFPLANTQSDQDKSWRRRRREAD